MKIEEIRKEIITFYMNQWAKPESWVINKDGNVDVYGEVRIKNFEGTKLPFKFGIVTGTFNTADAILNSVENFPTEPHGFVYRGNEFVNQDTLKMFKGENT